jgi:glucose-1-phosphate adenylyltransferase
MPSSYKHLNKKVMAIVLAGGAGSRLKDLTQWRAKPAVPFGGKYRIIDFALSNCVNSGIRKILVLTQYKSHSLIRHLQRAWSFMRYEADEFVEIVPAQQRVSKEWYEGTADAIHQNLDIIRQRKPEYILILGGDHIYTMDYEKMLAAHVESGAEVTVGCIEVPRMEATGFGVMSVDDGLNITKFTEKPADPESVPGKPDVALASMGIYIFSTEFLARKLDEDRQDPNSSRDFGKDIIPSSIGNAKVIAYPFVNEQTGEPDYWRDVGTVESYWKANMELCAIESDLNLYDRDWPIWTYQAQMPSAKFVFDDKGRRGEAIDSLVASGCIISGARVKLSVIFSGCHLHSHSLVKDSVILPNVDIARNCRINKAIIDKGVRIPEGTIIGESRADDEARFYVDEHGISLVTPEMLGQTIHVRDE